MAVFHLSDHSHRTFFSLLPGAGTLIGMNFYTGLSISLLAVLGYYFCTKVLKIPALLVFLGEFTAVSFCWCPTGSFYNYVTYVFYLVSVVCLYLGLARGKGVAVCRRSSAGL